MKKIFIPLIILSSFFIFSNSVNAEYYSDGNITYDYEFLKNLISEQYQGLNIDDFDYFVSRTVVYDKNYPNVTPQLQFVFWNGEEPEVLSVGDDTIMILPKSYEVIHSGNLVIKDNSNFNVDLRPNLYYFGDGFPLTFKEVYDFENSSLSYHSLKSSSKGFTDISYGDKTYSFDNSSISTGFVDTHEFSKQVSGIKYSKVEFVFDIKGNMEQSLDFGYDFHLVQANGEIDDLNSFNSPYFIETSSFSLDNGTSSLPKDNYFRVVSSGLESCISDSYGLSCYDKNNILIKDTSLVGNSYSIDKFTYSINNNPLEKVTSSLKFVLDLEFNSSVIVDAFFKSSIPFDVIYHERTSFIPDENYYDTIDLTGKYGVLFLPKLDTSISDLSVRTLFRGIGHLDVQHRTGIDPVKYDILSAYSMNYCHKYLSTQQQIPYSCNVSSGEFEFYLNNDNLKQVLFFINSKFEESATAEVSISYDKRYYVYYVFDTPSSVVKVTNPNTNEETFTSLENFYNFADVDAGFLKSLIKQISDFFHEKIPALNQFKMIISLFTYHADYEDAPTLEIDLNSIGINQKATIIDFSIFQKYRSTVFFWEMLGITTITIVKVTDNIVKAFKGD